MKRSFSTRITGRQWWKPFLSLLAALFVTTVAFCLSWMRFIVKPTPIGAALNALASLALLFPVLFVFGLFLFFVYRRTVLNLTVGGEKFSIACSFGEFAGVYSKGFFLVFITAGVYAPRFFRQVLSYVLHATELNGHRCAFKGKTRKLFRSFIGLFYIPCAVYIAILTALPFFLDYSQGTASARSLAFAVQIGLAIVFLSTQGLFFSRFVSWLIDLKFGNRRIRLEGDSRAAGRFFLAQFALTACTLGIYAPLAAILGWRYIAQRIRIDDNAGKMHFTGSLGKGCFLVWGNALLSACTFGLWTPWACASIIRYFVNESFVTLDR